MLVNRIAAATAFAMAAVVSCGIVSAADDSSQQGPWPGWRGKDRTNVSTEKGLLKEWPKGGPKLVWTFDAAGFGYGDVAIVGSDMYLLGKDDDGEFIKKLSTDGKEVKKAKLDDGRNKYATGWGGGPRSTPVVDGDLVFAMSSDGRVSCYDRNTLAEKWTKSLADDFGSKTPRLWWGYSESPLVDGEKVVVTPGGKNCVVALNKNTGETVWTSTGIEDGQQYASIMPMTVDGKRMYVTQTDKHLIGVDAENGKLLWKFGEIVRKTAVIPTPIISGNRAYATAAYDAGCECVEIEKTTDGFTANKVYVNQNMMNHHGGVILLDGHIYGCSGNNAWVCQKFSDGSAAWKHQSRDAGKGSIAYADGRFYCFEEKPGGSCILIEASPEAWKEHGRLKLPKNSSLERGRGAVWSHPVIADGKLYLRDLDLLYCFDVKAP
jgi:outer membrane protein assembly factor BamB